MNVSGSKESNPKPLFEIGNDVEVKLIDCMLRAEVMKKTVEDTLHPRVTSDVCIHVQPQNEGMNGGKIQLVACSIINFFTHIISGSNSYVVLEDCGLSNSSNSSILAINPLHFEVHRSTFEDCGAAAIEIRWVQSLKRNTGSLFSENREIIIQGNRILRSKTSGISLCSEKMLANPKSATAENISLQSVLISDTSITECGTDGIIIKNATSNSKIKLERNRIMSNAGNGIFISSSMQKINAKSNEPYMIDLLDNYIEGCKLSGISIFDSSCQVTNCECALNAECGLLINNRNISAEKRYQYNHSDQDYFPGKRSRRRPADIQRACQRGT
eukprot:TRINITY_DN16346_c0_g1_i1.p1 TRINITY_DN16346_c0_g1~~TRINITY_DN16346_c0_g1_i1.p1  ORF type:complete len:329 (+),score=21.55 TRINITY_DN16346_c0_g1_i1:412-1398(+)